MALNLMPLDSNKNIIYNPKPLAIRQGEKGIVLPVVLTAKNIGVKDLANVNLNFEATKPDGKIVLDENQNHFTKSDGYFEYVLPSEVYQSVGEVKGHFILKYSGDVIDTTSDFSIKVLSRTGQDEKSSDYISAAETIVEESRQKLQQIIDVVTTATDQIDLTKSNLTSDVSKFLSDTQTTVNANVKTLTDNLNQLKNTFTTNIESAEGVFESKKKDIDDWFTKSQQDYTVQKQSIDSEWTAKKAEKDSDWLKLKASYDSKIAGLTNQYQTSVDTQKKQLSDDLANFKSQLKSQLDSTQSTINQLKNSDVPAISKKLDSIRADIDKIDLDSVKRKSDDAYSMADSTAKKVDEFDARIESKATATSVYSWQVTDLKISQANSRVISQANSYTDSKVANAKPDLSAYYDKTQVDNKDLATQNQAVEFVKSQLVGDTNALATDDKSSVVNAINWLYKRSKGGVDLNAPVIPYATNSETIFKNQKLLYKTDDVSYQKRQLVRYNPDFANSTLSNVGDGLKIWLSLRRIAGDEITDDFPIIYNASSQSGGYATDLQLPLTIKKGDIAVSDASETKSITIELSGAGEVQNGEKVAPRIKITNSGDSGDLVIESVDGCNFGDKKIYYTLAISQITSFEFGEEINFYTLGTSVGSESIGTSNYQGNKISSFNFDLNRGGKSGLKFSTYFYTASSFSSLGVTPLFSPKFKYAQRKTTYTSGDRLSFGFLVPSEEIIEGNIIRPFITENKFLGDFYIKIKKDSIEFNRTLASSGRVVPQLISVANEL